MTSYYDHILGLIPLAFVAVAAIFTLTGYSTAVAIPAAGGVGVALVGHALFVRGPTDEPAVPAATTTTAATTAGPATTPDDRAPMPAAE
ncbi:hypothetical protein J2752_002521 [Halarchaeum rubridurum]|uniref:Uncharacterized protein n=1 Tax=Halarchaeum rubridurum TaxID=489911 RepID=A0A830G3K3_9EURY|nr:hypothetical protein [Halarchaeum rubridurum]MBP1955598.1 hypothetical protein [Halarchaeum rubridurum]GGM73637.1 hypothetical protein GCM10009017_24470 [Halarchaeum rubridurum]